MKRKIELTMNMKKYIRPAIKLVDAEVVAPMAASITFNDNVDGYDDVTVEAKDNTTSIWDE